MLDTPYLTNDTVQGLRRSIAPTTESGCTCVSHGATICLARAPSCTASTPKLSSPCPALLGMPCVCACNTQSTGIHWGDRPASTRTNLKAKSWTRPVAPGLLPIQRLSSAQNPADQNSAAVLRIPSVRQRDGSLSCQSPNTRARRRRNQHCPHSLNPCALIERVARRVTCHCVQIYHSCNHACRSNA